MLEEIAMELLEMNSDLACILSTNKEYFMGMRVWPPHHFINFMIPSYLKPYVAERWGKESMDSKKWKLFKWANYIVGANDLAHHAYRGTLDTMVYDSSIFLAAGLTSEIGHYFFHPNNKGIVNNLKNNVVSKVKKIPLINT